MENYLLELIRENNRIIIPNFGAFIVSREKGRNILFNNFLSFNDGLLISHICAIEGVDSASATQKVDDYVAHLNSTLDEKGLFEIEGIGQFTKDESGVLRFEQTPSELTEIDDKEDAEGLASDVEDRFDSSDDNDLLDLEVASAEDTPIKAPIVVKEDSLEKAVEPAPDAAVAATVGIPPVQKINKKADDVPVQRVARENIYLKKEEKSRPVGLILLIILILILLIGSTLWFFTGVFDDFKGKDRQREQIEAVPEKVEETSADEESGFVEEEVVEEAVIVSTRQHHIIVGSYRDETMAREKMQVLMNKGYATASILPYEGRFLLSVEWYPSVNKALQRQEALLTELQIENWVLSLTVK